MTATSTARTRILALGIGSEFTSYLFSDLQQRSVHDAILRLANEGYIERLGVDEEPQIGRRTRYRRVDAGSCKPTFDTHDLVAAWPEPKAKCFCEGGE